MKPRLPAGLKQSSLAQSHLISSILVLFRHDERLRELLFHHQELQLRATPEEILKESRCFSRSERILIRIGLDFWSDSGNSRISDIVEYLDDDNVMAFIRAILKLREMDLYVSIEEEPPCFD
jgi:hypothetical protein